MVKYSLSWIGLLCWVVVIAHASSEHGKAQHHSGNNSSSLQICGCLPRSFFPIHRRLSKYLHPNSYYSQNPSEWLSLLNSLSGHKNGLHLPHLRIIVDVITHIANSAKYLVPYLNGFIQSGHLGPKEKQDVLYKLAQFWIQGHNWWWIFVKYLTNGSQHDFGSHIKSWKLVGDSLLKNPFTLPSNMSNASSLNVLLGSDFLKGGEKFNLSSLSFPGSILNFTNLPSFNPHSSGNFHPRRKESDSGSKSTSSDSSN